MKISLIDRGSGIAQQFARALGARTRGRFIDIPKSKGGGYLTGFGWGRDLRVMIKNYWLHENLAVERTNELDEGQEELIFLLNGIFPLEINGQKELSSERANIVICRRGIYSMVDMPSNTRFGSVTIAVSRSYLQQLFGHIDHPVVANVLRAKENFVIELDVSPSIIATGSDMLGEPVPGVLESHYYKLKCEELLCECFALLLKREEVPAVGAHMDDLKAIYAIKAHLQAHPDEPPQIAELAKGANMSQPKLRKLFKQTFGKGVFEYYQGVRMQMAASLLKDKKLTVAEVGYQLGFTNLSHFSRVFEEYIGMKPKKYSAA